ncbi:hypothetical protein AAG906_004566 [Vitis piasezkii]
MRSGGEVGRRRGGCDSGGGGGYSVLCRSLSSLLPIDGNLSYRKLSLDLYKLSILKLDGTSFDVQIARNAKVAELKQAIEEVFSLSTNEDEENISWSHVWGHFCLCYEGQKLVNDKAHIRDIGIQDGDQLQFIQHITTDRNSKKKQPKKESVACRQSQMLFAGSRQREGDGTEDEEEIPMPEFKLAHFLKGWLPYSRARSMGRRGSEGRICSSRFGGRCLGVRCRPGIIRLGA